nr:copper resistance protein CopC [Longispora sp. (in: high G+C Gram-positive bacteria)]
MRKTLPLPLSLFFLILVASVLLPAVRADAHAVLERADIPAGAVVPQAPTQITLTFSESVQPVTVRIIGPDGKQVEEGKASARGKQV